MMHPGVVLDDDDDYDDNERWWRSKAEGGDGQ
jgi:hypothetical protein